ncbi:GerAB/ArcD/ProY family transporter [Paenibacillus pini]|uniref:Spore germination protein GerKB n=1 Tax=Paenibacillus pini JCM 16418 TaxID=1236976 RepID=W7YZP6_9BACL|nr:endospore germination permease [Paenibacillus pini]GAF10126.1 spore germination protein GerKB [Paenibacillus pini JCM 16418]
MPNITSRQVILLGVTYIINITLIHVPSQLAGYGRQHAYLSFLVAGLVVALLLLVLTRSANRFPGQDLFQSLTSRFPIIGRFIGLLYLLFFFFILTRDMRSISDFTNVLLLPNTPIFVIGLCVATTVVYIVRGGLRTLIGITELYGPILIIVVFFMVFVVFKDFNTGYLKPVLYIDWAGVGKGSWIAFSYLGQVLALPFICSGKNYRYRHGLYSLLIGTGLLTLIILMLLLILGAPITERMMYPTYELVRQLRVTDFLDRFDLILVALWFPAALLNVAISYTLFVMVLRRSSPLFPVK